MDLTDFLIILLSKVEKLNTLPESMRKFLNLNNFKKLFMTKKIFVSIRKNHEVMVYYEPALHRQ